MLHAFFQEHFTGQEHFASEDQHQQQPYDLSLINRGEVTASCSSRDASLNTQTKEISHKILSEAIGAFDSVAVNEDIKQEVTDLDSGINNESSDVDVGEFETEFHNSLHSDGSFQDIEIKSPRGIQSFFSSQSSSVLQQSDVNSQEISQIYYEPGSSRMSQSDEPFNNDSYAEVKKRFPSTSQGYQHQEIHLNNHSDHDLNVRHNTASPPTNGGSSTTKSSAQHYTTLNPIHRSDLEHLTRSLLNNQMDDYTSYICPICFYNARMRYKFDRHLGQHLNHRTFCCRHCGYRTILKPSLVVHLRKHTGERPYRCTLCDYSSAQKSNLDCHMRKHGRDAFRTKMFSPISRTN